LLGTCRYSDIVAQPSFSATRAIDSPASPSASATSIAAATIRSSESACLAAPRRRSARFQSASRLRGRSPLRRVPSFIDAKDTRDAYSIHYMRMLYA